MNEEKICFIDPKFLKSIGGVETHGYEFVRHFLKDRKTVLTNTSKDKKIYFFNNPNWLPMAEYIKKSRPHSKIFVRSGGNDIMAGWIGNENSKKEPLLKSRKFLVNLI